MKQWVYYGEKKGAGNSVTLFCHTCVDYACNSGLFNCSKRTS